MITEDCQGLLQGYIALGWMQIGRDLIASPNLSSNHRGRGLGVLIINWVIKMSILIVNWVVETFLLIINWVINILIR